MESGVRAAESRSRASGISPTESPRHGIATMEPVPFHRSAAQSKAWMSRRSIFATFHHERVLARGPEDHVVPVLRDQRTRREGSVRPRTGMPQG